MKTSRSSATGTETSPVAGGPPRTLATIPSPYGIYWSERGIYVGLGGGIGPSPEGGNSKPSSGDATESAQGRAHANGDWIVFRWPPVTGLAGTLRELSLSPATGEHKVLIEGASDARYIPTVICSTAPAASFLVPFDVTSVAVRGRRRPHPGGCAQQRPGARSSRIN